MVVLGDSLLTFVPESCSFHEIKTHCVIWNSEAKTAESKCVYTIHSTHLVIEYSCYGRNFKLISSEHLVR